LGGSTRDSLRDALLSAKSFENDPDLLLGRELPSSVATDLTDGGIRGLLLLRHVETLLGVLDPEKCL
jgi:hypothetical protein